MHRELTPTNRAEFGRAWFAVPVVPSSIGVVALTLLPWFGTRLSGVPEGTGFVAYLPDHVATSTPWQASIWWSIVLVLTSLITIATVTLAVLRRAGSPGIVVIALGLTQATTILVFDRFGVSRPFPADTEMVDEATVTLSYGLLTAGRVALILALAIAVLGGVFALRGRRHRAKRKTLDPQRRRRGNRLPRSGGVSRDR